MLHFRISVVVFSLLLLIGAPIPAREGKKVVGGDDLRSVVKDKNKSWELRVAAAEALGKQGAKAADAVEDIGGLLTELSQSSADLGKAPLVRRTVKVLASFGPAATPAVASLAKAALLDSVVVDSKTKKDRNAWEEVNLAAISALGKTGSSKAVAELLGAHLTKDGANVRRAAAISALEGVALTGSAKERTNVLILLRVTAASDADLDIRRMAKDAIKKIETKFPKKRGRE